MNIPKKLFLIVALILTSCASTQKKYTETTQLDLSKMMGPWYVMAGRFTSLEKNVHNGIETYSWNTQEKRIDISFTYNKDSFNGEKVSFNHKAWVYDPMTQAFWKFSPFWPLKFDYIFIDKADDYSWVASGVPDQGYLWILARDYKMTTEKIRTIIERLKAKGYDTSNIVFVPHQHN